VLKIAAEKIDETGVTARVVWFARSIRAHDDGDLKIRTLEIKKLPGDTQVVSVSGNPTDYTRVRVFNTVGEMVHSVEFDSARQV
jgi:hypothetical protein